MSTQMNAQSFARLLKTHPDMLNDAGAFAAVLREAYPDEKGSVNLMITAYNADVISMLRGGKPGDLLLVQIVLCLMDDYGIAEEKARWTAALWRDAYAAAGAGEAPAAETKTAAPSLAETDPSCFEVEPNEQGCTIKKYTGPHEGEVVIPARINGKPVTEIGFKAFYECFGLTSVNIPHGVTEIGDLAFYFCIDLTEVIIPDSVTTIGVEAFGFCDHLTSVAIPDSVQKIGDLVFAHCHSLTSITIPDSVTEIGNCAFSKTGLTEVTIPYSVQKIENRAFAGCSNLTDVTIPNINTRIGRDAFSGCSPSLVIHSHDAAIARGVANEYKITYEPIHRKE